MGEKIKDIAKVRFGKCNLLIEKNKGTHTNRKIDIHIQSEKVTLNLSEDDFLKIASCILYAEENLNSYKKK